MNQLQKADHATVLRQIKSFDEALLPQSVEFDIGDRIAKDVQAKELFLSKYTQTSPKSDYVLMSPTEQRLAKIERRLAMLEAKK